MSGFLSGSISVTLENGEVYEGPWALVSETPRTSAPAVIPLAMADDWDDVYGTGYFTAHVLGSQVYARATLTGSE